MACLAVLVRVIAIAKLEDAIGFCIARLLRVLQRNVSTLTVSDGFAIVTFREVVFVFRRCCWCGVYQLLLT